MFLKTLKHLLVLALVLVIALGGIHFHAFDQVSHQECLACHFINQIIISAALSLALLTLFFVTGALTQISSHVLLLQIARPGLRAPPQ